MVASTALAQLPAPAAAEALGRVLAAPSPAARVRGVEALGRVAAAALQSPATHAILTRLEAGEGVFVTLSLTDTVSMHLEEHNHCIMHVLA